MYQPSFGRLEPSVDKRNLHYNTYGFQRLGLAAPAVVEVDWPEPPEFSDWYFQGQMNACVGAAWSKTLAVINLAEAGPQRIDWKEFYRWCCENDNDPRTTYKADIGTYVWAGGDCAMKMGAYLSGIGWQIEHGIDSYYWPHTMDELRTAATVADSAVLGVPWLFGQPENRNGLWWIPKRSKWGKMQGGHCIKCGGVKDSLGGAVSWRNTWNGHYPAEVWIDPMDMEYILTTLGGECAAVIDKEDAPPPPPEPEEEAMKVEKIELWHKGEKIVEVEP